MKRTFTKAVCAIALIAAFAGCAKEDMAHHQKNTDSSSESDKKAAIPVTLRAEQENKNRQPDSRATTGETSSDGGITSIVWSSEDKLSVFDGGNANKELTLYSGAGTISGTFKGEVDAESDSYVALHPYQSAATINSDRTVISGVTLKSSQTAMAGSFDPEAALMTAVETDGMLNFKNVVGYVRVTPEFDCSKISLVSNNSSDVLAGTVDVTLTGSDGVPSVAPSSGATDASDTVSIEGTISAGTEYYIAVLPAALSSGFRLVFTPAESAGLSVAALLRTTTKSFEITRNSCWNLGTMAGLTVGDIMLSVKSDNGDSYNAYVARVADGDTLPSDLQSSAIGIVAHLYDADGDTRACYTGLTNTLGQMPAGLVLALKNAAPDPVIWATHGTTNNYCRSLAEAYSNSDDGCTVLTNIRENTANLFKGKTGVELAKALKTYSTSFYAAFIYNYTDDYSTDYSTTSITTLTSKNLPEETTEWHLPCYGEWCDILGHFGGSSYTEHQTATDTEIKVSGWAEDAIELINVCLKKAGEGNYDAFSLSTYSATDKDAGGNTLYSETGGYWTCTDYKAAATDTSSPDAFNIIFDDDKTLIFSKTAKKTSLRQVRCVLAF